MDKLMEKLIAAKAIMDKTDNIKRGEVRDLPISESVSSFDIPPAKYNIPNEFMVESQNLTTTKVAKQPTIDAIKNSKLPDEIKKLMIENPIVVPQQKDVTISNDIIEKASRLMRENNSNVQPQIKEVKSTNQQIDYKVIQKMINEAVDKAFEKNKKSEESENSNESFSFKVGSHIFEGKITKIKKIT
jgi:hypothetical protein